MINFNDLTAEEIIMNLYVEAKKTLDSCYKVESYLSMLNDRDLFLEEFDNNKALSVLTIIKRNIEIVSSENLNIGYQIEKTISTVIDEISADLNRELISEEDENEEDEDNNDLK